MAREGRVAEEGQERGLTGLWNQDPDPVGLLSPVQPSLRSRRALTGRSKMEQIPTHHWKGYTSISLPVDIGLGEKGRVV